MNNFKRNKKTKPEIQTISTNFQGCYYNAVQTRPNHYQITAATTICKFGENCKNDNCKYYHAPTKIETELVTFLESDNEKHEITRVQPIDLTKKEKICMFWVVGTCKYGADCQYQHPPKKPNLTDILEHCYSTTKNALNIEDYICYTTPDLRLPELPLNGMCRMMPDKELAIYFIPFYKPIDGIVYYKKIRLFRYNKKKEEFKLVFSYTKQGFHITSAAASNGYLVCSRLPYDIAVFKMMEEAKKLKKQNENLQEKIRLKDERLTKQISQLKTKNRYLSNNFNRKPVSSLRANANFNMVVKHKKLELLEFSIRDKFRSADPVDLFVYDPVIKTHIQVLEYHKPADYVDLNGKILHLWDKKTGRLHTFSVKMGTNQVSNYDFDEPLKPEKLCDEF